MCVHFAVGRDVHSVYDLFGEGFYLLLFVFAHVRLLLLRWNVVIEDRIVLQLINGN